MYVKSRPAFFLVCMVLSPFLLITLAVDNETMLGLKKAEAGNDLVDVKKSKKLVKKSKVEEQDEDEEEWGGIDLEAMKE